MQGVDLIHRDKVYLLTPGPTPVHPKALEAMARPIIHHRTKDYERILEGVREGLRYLFQVQDEVLIFASSGTGGMEGAVVNCLSQGDKAIVVRGGKFGSRWGEICQAYGIKVLGIDVEWGQSVDPATVAELLQKEPGVRAVLVQACETSTGVAHDVKTIGEIVRRYEDTLMIVDAVSALGAYEVPGDAWGLDVVVTGSQKALMLPPGLALVSVSRKAWNFVERSNLPKYYFDFMKERAALSKNQSAYTAAISLVIGLGVVLEEIRREGLENVFARHHRLADGTRKAVEAIGLELLAKESPSDSVTAIKVPPEIECSKLRSLLRDKYRVIIAGGQEKLKDKIFRITHMGYVDAADLTLVLSALEMALGELGYPVKAGTGVATFQKAILD